MFKFPDKSPATKIISIPEYRKQARHTILQNATVGDINPLALIGDNCIGMLVNGKVQEGQTGATNVTHL
jgi:hypothetical protein